MPFLEIQMAKTKTSTKKLSRLVMVGLRSEAVGRVRHRVAVKVVKTPFFNPPRKTAILPA